MAINRNMTDGGGARRTGPSAKPSTSASTPRMTRQAIPNPGTTVPKPSGSSTPKMAMNATPIKSALPAGGRKAPVPKDTKVGKIPAVKSSPARVDGKVGRQPRGQTGGGRAGTMPTRDTRAELMNAYRKSGGNQR